MKKHNAVRKPRAVEQDAGKPRLHERRTQPRFTTQFRSTFSGKKQEGQGWTLDISAGGCKIESETPVEQGVTMECRLHIPGLDWPLRVDEAIVRWVDGKMFGIGFIRIAPTELEKLQTILAHLGKEIHRA